jgi:hypothetical protein
MAPDAPERQGGWKDIAAYLGRSVRTVQRWEEQYGLPVRRIHTPRGATVLAYREELDAWRSTPQGEAALSEHVALRPPPASHESRNGLSGAGASGAVRADGGGARPRVRYGLPLGVWVTLGVVAVALLVMSHAPFGGETMALVCPEPCVLTQGETLVLHLDGAGADDAYIRWIRSANGRVESFRPTLAPDAAGRVTWGFTTDCSSQPGRYELRLVHGGSSLRSSGTVVTIHPHPDCGGPVADLVAEAVVIERTAAGVGDRVVCHFTLRNQGTLHAPASVTRLRLGRSPDRTAVTDLLLADVPVPALAVGSTVTLTHTVTLPEDLQPGANYYIWIVADNGSAVLERVSTNNFARSAPLLIHPRS